MLLQKTGIPNVISSLLPIISSSFWKIQVTMGIKNKAHKARIPASLICSNLKQTIRKNELTQNNKHFITIKLMHMNQKTDAKVRGFLIDSK